MFNVTAGAGTSGIAYQLGQNGRNLQRSLERLSTMSRINSSSDDPGGLGVSMKLGLSIRRTEAALSQVGSVQSFLQTQDGVLSVADRVVQRMGELATLASGTLSSSDRNIYSTEFQGLQSYLGSMLGEQFNGQSLFSNSGATTAATSASLATTLTITGETMGISQADFGSVTNLVGTAAATSIDITSQSSAAAAYSAVSNATNNLATLRALNGSQQSRVDFASDLLETNKLNLEAANSRILSVDFAAELVNYTTSSILEQQNVALLAQANSRSENILRLLNF
jgi:flagellin